MSQKQAQDDEKEKQSAMMHVTRQAFPAAHLPPWMSIHTTMKAHALAGIKALSRIGQELDRRAWFDAHPGKTAEDLPEKLQDRKEDGTLRDDDPEWAPTKARGGVAMYSYALKCLAEEIHDIAPSVGGIGRKQSIWFGSAQRTGVTPVASQRSRLEKATGRGKDKEQISSME